MSKENNIPLFNEQCEVSQTQTVYNAYDIYLDEDIKDPSYYRNAFQVLRTALQGDLIRIYISTVGGDMETAIMFRNNIQGCQADVIAVVEGQAFSAGSLIALSCPSIEVKPYSTMMLHNASFGSVGSVQNIRDHVDFTSRHAESLMEEVYKGFITEEEMVDLKRGRELWFDYNQISERLDKMFDADQCEEPNKTLEQVIKGLLEEVLEAKFPTQKAAKAPPAKKSPAKPKKLVE